MILVVGATGMLGGRVCSGLAEAGSPGRALVRASCAPEKVAHLRQLGFETVVADLRDAASLAPACAGVDAVVCTVSSMPFSYEPGVNDIQTTDLAGVRSLIDAAVGAGVGHFVDTSFSADLDLDFPLARAKRAVEAHLVDSGMAYTILRPSFFMDVWLSPAVGFDPVNGTVTIYGDGTAPVSYIAAGDVAAFAVSSLTAPGARNAILELGGPQALSQLDAAAVYEQVTGRSIATQSVPVEALQAQAAAATDEMQQSFASLMICLARGNAIDMRDLPAGLPTSLTSVEQFARAQVA